MYSESRFLSQKSIYDLSELDMSYKSLSYQTLLWRNKYDQNEV